MVTTHVYVWWDSLCVCNHNCGSLTKTILMVPFEGHDPPTCSSPQLCVPHRFGRTLSGDGLGNHVNRPGLDFSQSEAERPMGSTEGTKLICYVCTISYLRPHSFSTFVPFGTSSVDLDGVPRRLPAAMGERFNRVRRLESIDTRIRVAVVNKVALPSESNRRQRVVACIVWVLSDTPALGDAYLHSKGSTTYSSGSRDRSKKSA